MFVVLRVNDTPKSFLKKKKCLKTLSKEQIQCVPTKRGMPFYCLDIPSKTSEKEWKIIAKKCGRYASRIVAPRNLSLPDFGGLKRFVPSFLPSVLVFNTAIKAIEKAAFDPRELCITLTDRNALHSSNLFKLLPFASTIRVVTTYPEKYASACKSALDEHGASIIIRSSYEPCSKSEIVICSDGVFTPLMHSSAVFGYKHTMTGKINFYGNGIELTDIHAKIIPPNIEQIDFAGAVTELCGSTEYKSAVFSSVITDCAVCDKPSPEKCLKCYLDGRL